VKPVCQKDEARHGPSGTTGVLELRISPAQAALTGSSPPRLDAPRANNHIAETRHLSTIASLTHGAILEAKYPPKEGMPCVIILWPTTRLAREEHHEP
jgi:hypothetical protein